MNSRHNELTREEWDHLSKKGLEDYLKWADGRCGSAVRARALLQIHDALDKWTTEKDVFRFVDRLKEAIGR